MMEAWQSSTLGGIGSPSGGVGSSMNPLASGGDAHYLDESIHPSTIRGYFTQGSTNPSNPTSTPNLIRGMKWLLASMSKGRDVSDFFPHVVKLTGATYLEVRKMVYMYLVQYSDHDDTCRELALLSINSFQRGLADAEQLIRALALRALTSIRVEEIIHIQILAVQTCALSDRSPYVRKCAANALSKLWRGYGRGVRSEGNNDMVQGNLLDSEQRSILLDILKKLLSEETSTMVLSSAIVAFVDMSSDKNENLHLLHGCYRKLCHLLTDMDEWGQVALLDVLQRYCRTNFTNPGEGSAVKYDREKALRRDGGEFAYETIPDVSPTAGTTGDANNEPSTSTVLFPPHPRQQGKITKVKRRVIKKAFYSDEEDESTEEEVTVGLVPGSIPVVAATKAPSNFGPGHQNDNDPYKDDDDHLDEDHRLLLRSSIPLLKSRNSAVVLAVCRLHYYCGVSSIKTRASMGKALVRIHRDKREIQYVVLTSIRALADTCPSAFTPYLHDFFIKAMDPSFTRQIKLEILSVLALQPDAIRAVLDELQTYIRHDDKVFVQSAIRVVGKMIELASKTMTKNIGKPNGPMDGAVARSEVRAVALNCLHGLQAFMMCSRHPQVVGECILVMRQVLVHLQNLASEEGVDGLSRKEDPYDIQGAALRRILVIVLGALAPEDVKEVLEEDGGEGDDGESGAVAEKETEKKRALPAEATAGALWIVGELVLLSDASSVMYEPSKRAKVRQEIMRLAAKRFPELEPPVKLQTIHLASKCIVLEKVGPVQGALSPSSSPSSLQSICHYILSMGKVDTNIDVRDRSRFESALLDMAETNPEKISWQTARMVLISKKPPKSSTLPLSESVLVEDAIELGEGGILGGKETEFEFPFGTLSSLVGHRAGSTFSPLPPWATVCSPSSLREPAPVGDTRKLNQDATPVVATVAQSSDFSQNFFDGVNNNETDSSSETSSTSSGSSTDESSDDDDDESTSSSSDSSSSDDTTDSDDSESDQPDEFGREKEGGEVMVASGGVDEDSDDSSETGSSDSDSASESSSDDEAQEGALGSATEGNLLSLGVADQSRSLQTKRSSGLEDLVMAPLVVDNASGESMGKNDAERESSAWTRLVRHELAGGLEVQSRYLRGEAATREAKLLKMNEGSVIVQLKFQNMRNDRGILRHIRLIQRSVSGHGAPKNITLPQEIVALGVNQTSIATVGLDFGRPSSDRDGTCVVRLDVKSDQNTNAVEIRPPLCELLKPLRLTKDKYNALDAKMAGQYQRVTNTLQVDAGTLSSLPELIMRNSNVASVDGNITFGDEPVRFGAVLPFSGDPVLLSISREENGFANLTIVCDDALASTAMMNYLKSAIC